MSLSKLTKVDLRKGWAHEAIDFTNWLALEENLTLLGDEIGLDIKLVSTEAEVGAFSADILAEEENTGKRIIIENQLEVTNHDHLGKIITYASGHDANYVIWVVKDVREEHRKAVDWLNEHTDEETEFYLLKIELWQIEDSPMAPKFEIISKPNDWAKAVKESVSSAKLTGTKIKQLEFWNQLIEFAKKSHPSIRPQKARPQHWLNARIGDSDAHMSFTIRTTDDHVGVELYIPDNKELYSHLLAHRQEIEKALMIGGEIEWMELPAKKASRIRISAPADFSNEAGWQAYYVWMLDVAEKFRNVFPKYLKSFRG